ncbi:MAG: endonuclease/exonuclease/phosphatase family protein [Myxococcota bacterium]|jgi:endonuclease/exonuclease/phosphatase family metal-dependent hydrolase|nr:endonuclease/exonuclease/phosphatase family protein [Myxococcota bacterium]
MSSTNVKEKSLARQISRSGLTLWMLLLSACDPCHTGFDDIEEAVLFQAQDVVEVEDPGEQIHVMTWNIKFGGGRISFFWECDGERSIMKEEEVLANMELVAEKINQAQPDILLIQEIEANSKRAAYMDQVQWLLDKTYFNYAAYASQWKADFVPSDGIGKINSGSAVLSRWPFAGAQRIALPLIGDHDPVTRYFYLKRNVLTAKLQWEGRVLHVVNTHTSAFSKDGTKRKQLLRFKEVLDGIAAQNEVFVAGGDLNSLPSSSPKRRGFADECDDAKFKGDDYTGQDAWLDELYNDYTPAVSLVDFATDPAPHYTFTGDENISWNRKLDYLFTNGAWVDGTTLTHQDMDSGGLSTIERSDHAPLSVVLDFGL